MEPTLDELKVRAYDTMAAISHFNNQLREIEKQIANYVNKLKKDGNSEEIKAE